MGINLNRFRKAGQVGRNLGLNAGRRIDNFANKQINSPERIKDGKIVDNRPNPKNVGMNNFNDPFFDDDLDSNFDNFNGNNGFNDIGIQPAQKPASFHHFILENQYKDLEKSIRGYKDVYNKEKGEWDVKRKESHCFTDEESEDILRTAQSHLATDIKLTFYDKEKFGLRFLAVYNEIEFLFKRIMEYRYGRYGDSKKQGEMKEQAVKIFVELITRIEANYLRAVQGMENKRTHDSVHSQESLQGDGMNGGFGMGLNRRYS
jgi:hypothetical protein